jgi:hypothetical protein
VASSLVATTSPPDPCLLGRKETFLDHDHTLRASHWIATERRRRGSRPEIIVLLPDFNLVDEI